MLATAAAHMVRLDLFEDGTLVLHPENRAASLLLTGLPREDVVLRPEQVRAVRDTVPVSEVSTGYVDIDVPGVPLRVFYRHRQTPDIRALLRAMGQQGYPERAKAGEVGAPEERPLELESLPLPL